MAQKQSDPAQPASQQKPSASGRAASHSAGDAAMTGTDPAKPFLPARDLPACEPHCVDVTGIAPEGMRVDPDITEGHPGYQESGDSELIPPDRLAAKNAAEEGPGG